MSNANSKNQDISPTAWLVTAKEYFSAVEKISLDGAKNQLQVNQSAPALTLLGYAFELVLKVGINLDGIEFDRIHDLNSLWKRTSNNIKKQIPDWTDKYTTENSDFLGYAINEQGSSEVLSVMKPKRGFDEEILRLNRWTDRPFYSRYPQVRGFEKSKVNINYMHAIGCQMVQYLEPIALEKLLSTK